MSEKNLNFYKSRYEYINSNTCIYKVKYKHEIDLIDKIISIYSIIKKDKKDKILPYEKSVLIYYILFGFNEESKEMIKDKLKKNENQINTTNSNLRSKGYLFKDSRNSTKGYVLKELKEMADTFMEDPSKIYALKFFK